MFFKLCCKVLLAFNLLTFSGYLLSATPAADLLSQLSSGGFVLYMRHAETNHQQMDSEQMELADCSTQRNLSGKGKQDALLMQRVFEQQGIKFDRVISSPFCRTKETADLAFGRSDTEHYLYFSLGISKAEREQSNHQLITFLNTPPVMGKNNVAVSHTSNLSEAIGIWPKPEGVIYIFEPEPDQIKPKLIGKFTPGQLSRWWAQQ